MISLENSVCWTWQFPVNKVISADHAEKPRACDWSRIDSDIIGLVEKMVGGLQKHWLL